MRKWVCERARALTRRRRRQTSGLPNLENPDVTVLLTFSYVCLSTHRLVLRIWSDHRNFWTSYPSLGLQVCTPSTKRRLFVLNLLEQPFHRTGELLATTADLGGDELQALLKTGAIRCAAIDPRNEHIVVSADDKVIRVYLLDGLRLLSSRCVCIHHDLQA